MPQDGARFRLFIAPAGQRITLEVGKIACATWEPGRHEILLTLDPTNRFTPAARVTIDAPAIGGVAMRLVDGILERGAYAVPLGTAQRIVRFTVPK